MNQLDNQLYAILLNQKFSKIPDDDRHVTALYARLSRDDEVDTVSNSIDNQKKILCKYAEDNGFDSTRFYFDDGISGTHFNRPGFQQMLKDVMSGEVGTIIVKDLSRFGRHHILVDFFTEIYFPDNDIRFIAIHDSVDSISGENEFAPFKNIMNEWYARDTSKKVRAVFKSKGMSGGILCTVPIFGYKKDPDNKNHWLVDEEAAEIVRQIFTMYINGDGYVRIAKYLRESKIPTPTEYQKLNGLSSHYHPAEINCNWTHASVKVILNHREYLGEIINFKTTRKSYRNHKIIMNKPEDYAVFKDVNTPIITEEIWQAVHDVMAKKTRIPTVREKDIMQGFLYCADCGKRLYITRAYGRHKAYYHCSGYCEDSSSCTSHYIVQESLLQIVLDSLKSITESVQLDVDSFAKAIRERVNRYDSQAVEKAKKESVKISKRITELDMLFQNVFEEKVLGHLSEERYLKMTAQYEAEQQELKQKLSENKQLITSAEDMKSNVEDFISLVSQYSEITEVTSDILSELIDKIVVHERRKDKDGTSQEIEIYYKGVGRLDDDVV